MTVRGLCHRRPPENPKYEGRKGETSTESQLRVSHVPVRRRMLCRVRRVAARVFCRCGLGYSDLFPYPGSDIRVSPRAAGGTLDRRLFRSTAAG